MRILALPAGNSPRDWGRIHGETFRGAVQALAQIRTYLCTKVGNFKTTQQVLAAAAAHLPALERYDRSLYEELLGIAEGANASPEEIVVANHYTDLRDLDPDPKAWRLAPTRDDPAMAARGAASEGTDGCSMLWAETPTGRILAQTWDMHATAAPFVMMLEVPASSDAPGATLLTVTGCLGMTGMNTARVGICINNLNSTDATVGAVWPAMVRRALRERTAMAAREVIAASPIGSGHHYFVADKTHAFALESSGTRRKQVFDGGPSYCHTNHCLDGDIDARSVVPATSNTHERMTWLTRDLARAPVHDLADAWKRLGSEDGWPRNSINSSLATPEAPHGPSTCGGIAMNLDTGELWAQQGFIHNVAAETWQV